MNKHFRVKKMIAASSLKNEEEAKLMKWLR